MTMRLSAPFLLPTLLLALLLATTVPAAAHSGDAGPEAVARQVVDQLESGEYEAIRESFTPRMRAQVSAALLEQGWSALALPLGALQSRGAPETHEGDGTTTVVTPLEFERGTLNAIVSVDAAGGVSGLFLQPASPPASATASAEPPPADAGYRERDFSVGEGATALPGTLTMPDGDGPFPAVVLVHGSGPQDRDQTAGPNRPFRDLAHGLAARGVAALRYDKRTFAHRPAVLDPDFGVDDETTDDAVTALAALRATPGIDPERVFVFGHSLGALVAPRIARRAPGTAGAILLAAPARPLLDILPEQLAGMARLQGRDDEAGQAMLDALADSIARVRAGEDLPPAQSPLGAPAAYWRSVEAVDAIADARALAMPVLVLHGGRDIQVTDADWQGWQAAFADDPRVTLKRYPTLSHLGSVVEDDDPMAPYHRPGAVDEGLIDDVAAWVGAHGPTEPDPR